MEHPYQNTQRSNPRLEQDRGEMQANSTHA